MVNKKYIGSTTYVSDASRLTDTYGDNGDVAYVIDELTKKILSEYTKFNGHWIEVQADQFAQIATNTSDIASIQQTIGNINTVLEGVL